MSAATTTMTMPPAMNDAAQSSCPHCGNGMRGGPSYSALEAQKQIEDLQAQVRLLTQKASAAVDRWADYEDELERLRAERQASSPVTVRSVTPTPATKNRLSAFLSPPKSTPNLQNPQTEPVSTLNEKDLLAALNREQALRQEAEGKLDEASGELEELSAQLFQQANEMVATERKAKAKLEEQVEMLQQRDGDKRKRLDRLESAMGRIERVRNLLAPTSPPP